VNYQIQALDILLNEDCLLQRYFPLIQYKEILMKNFVKNHTFSKTECLELPDEILIEMGLPNEEMVRLFQRFLVMYDVKDSKLKEIEEIAANEAEADSFRELYLLPGVKAVRAKLYYDANYKSLSQIASAFPEQIIHDTSRVILQKGLKLKAPLPKEVRTHIAVAKALTIYAA